MIWQDTQRDLSLPAIVPATARQPCNIVQLAQAIRHLRNKVKIVVLLLA
jgi:hypothetical protein